MKRAFAVSMAVAVVATSLLGPAQAAKKKKPKKPPAPAPVQVDASYFMRRDGADCADPSGLYLSLVDAEDIDPGSCGNSTYGVVADEIGADPMIYGTREGDGVPVTLDATKEITGLVGVKSQSQQGTVRWGVGRTTLNVELSGLVDGEPKVIGSTTVQYDVLPGDMNQVYDVEYTIKPDPALDKAAFTALTLTLYNSGTSLHHGFYTTDNPSSYFKMGTWQ